MDELDRMFRRLVDVVRAEYPSLIDRPIEVGELYQSILPYRHHRRELGLETNQDYELLMMRLLAGERGYLRGDSRMQDRLRQELGASNPDTALFRGFSTATVSLDPEAVRRITTGEAAAAQSQTQQQSASSPSRAVADQPVAQHVADDRVPPERPRPATPPPPMQAAASQAAMPPAASSPDAETIVFRRTPAVGPMPPMPPVMSPPPAMPSPTPMAGATSAGSAGSSAARPTEPIVLRSNEKITIRPGGEVESSLGEPARPERPAERVASAAPAPPASAAPAPTPPLPSVGPPPRPMRAPSSSSPEPQSAASSTDAASARAGTVGAASGNSGATAAPLASPSARPTMATPQRGTHTIVASGDCRYCGGVLPEGRRITFCPHCGQNLTIQHCPACSTELELGWKFCTTCGRSVTDAANA